MPPFDSKPDTVQDSAPEFAPDFPPAPGPDLPLELATFAPPIVLAHHERHKYLVAYDVRESSRLQRLHKRLKDWGRPVQYSVFEFLLTGSEVERMWSMVGTTIDQAADWVILYRLSRPFHEAVRHIGAYSPDLPARDLIIFI